MAWLKAKSDVKFDVQIEIQCAIGEDPAICYERYVLGELDLDELRSNNRSFDKPLEDQNGCNTEKITFMGYAIKNSMLF